MSLYIFSYNYSEILIQSSKNSRKMLKSCKIAFSSVFVWVEALRPSQQFFSHVGTDVLSVSPWQRTTRKRMFLYIFCYFGILPLLYECKLYKIWNFEFSENLRPKKLLIY